MSLRLVVALCVVLGPAIASGSTLILTEVFYDHTGGDDTYEWVEIYNATVDPIDLSGYSLGWGGTDYTYGTAQLSGTIPGCTVWVVGGPSSDPENGNPVYDLVIDFEADLQNGGTASDGVALFDVEASLITTTTVPIDAVIYDSPNTNGLLDETGSPGTPDVGDAPEGSCIERIDWEDNWQINDSPTPGVIYFESPNCAATAVDESNWGAIKALYR